MRRPSRKQIKAALDFMADVAGDEPETAVGAALGPVEQTYPGKNALRASKALSPTDASRFRLMHEYRESEADE